MRCALLLLLTPALAWAGPLEAGNEAFWQGDFTAAARHYAALTEAHPQSPDAWYNRGCAEAQAGRLGPAIHAFEQALALAPDDEDAAHNLQQVRTVAVAEALESTSDERVVLPGDDDAGTALVTAASPGALALGFAVCWVLLFGLLTLSRRLAHGRRTAAWFGAVLTGLASLAFGALLWGRTSLLADADFGVVTAERGHVRNGPGRQYKPGAILVGGVKVRLRGEVDGWRQVVLPDGSEGWLPGDEVSALHR